MADLLSVLVPKGRRGSKPRCHLLTHGPADDVAARLSALAAPFATISSSDRWMPQGFADLEECQLHRAPRLIDQSVGDELRSWWLPAADHEPTTPNFDIASTCTIGGRKGLLLVEAKAHDAELNGEAGGRRIGKDWSSGREESHKTIGAAIAAACAGLQRATTLSWRISRDSRYQMSNRFAWAWKLTDLGVPVVLVYLGFLRASEMADRGTPFAEHGDWEQLVKLHSESLFPSDVWGKSWDSNGHALIPLIRSLEVPLDSRSQAQE